MDSLLGKLNFRVFKHLKNGFTKTGEAPPNHLLFHPTAPISIIIFIWFSPNEINRRIHPALFLVVYFPGHFFPISHINLIK